MHIGSPRTACEKLINTRTSANKRVPAANSMPRDVPTFVQARRRELRSNLVSHRNDDEKKNEQCSNHPPVCLYVFDNCVLTCVAVVPGC